MSLCQLHTLHVLRGQLKCDGTRAETRFRLSATRTSPFKSAGASVQSTTGSRAVRISGNNAGYTMFRGSVKGTGCPLHSLVSPSLPPCVDVCHHISAGVYLILSLKVEPSSRTLFCSNIHVIIDGVAVDLCGVFKHADYENRSVSSFRYINDDDLQSPSET